MTVRSATPEAVARMVEQGAARVVLLDVREPYERAYARIEPSIHIPMHEIPTRIDAIPRDRRVVVYCHHGHRSAVVAAYLEQRGFEDVVNLSEGIDGWSARVDRSVPRY